MTDVERFETVLRELGALWLRLGDLAEHLMVIGGQVIALESRSRGGDGVIEVETSVGPKVIRGYSFDLDLLYDGEGGWMSERLPEVLRSCGFERSTSFRWTKSVGTERVDIDLLVAPNAEEADLPTPMTTAAGGNIAVLPVECSSRPLSRCRYQAPSDSWPSRSKPRNCGRRRPRTPSISSPT